MAELDARSFETITPGCFISFTIPYPHLSDSLLRLAVLDSPIQPTESATTVAAMFVPESRESDWIFSTESGQLQLLLNSPGISRLILVGKQPIDGHHSSRLYHRTLENGSQKLNMLEVSLKPLFLVLSPKSCFANGIPEIPFLIYEDNVKSSVVLEKCIGSFVGEMLVEDVEIETGFESGKVEKREFRRRLRFKRMPNLVQTEIRIIPNSVDLTLNRVGIEEIGFNPDVRVLVHPYLAPMVATLSLISSHIEERIQKGSRPKALCIGVGGGALVTFLRTQLGFEVVGVELDEDVIRVAKKYFGLKDDQLIRIHIGDAVEYLEKDYCYLDGMNKFDVAMVDLDSSDVREGISAPPLDFFKKDVLLAVRSVLCESGIVVINVIPPNKLFYVKLISCFQDVFRELYEIDVGNGENYVLVASLSDIKSFIRDQESLFMNRLRLLVSGEYLGSIRKI